MTGEIASWEPALGPVPDALQEVALSVVGWATTMMAPDGMGVADSMVTDQGPKMSLYLKAMVNAGSDTPISSPSTTNSESFFKRFGAVCSLSDCGN